MKHSKPKQKRDANFRVEPITGRRITQFHVVPADVAFKRTIYALCDDGSMWVMASLDNGTFSKWNMLPDLQPF